MTPERRDPLRDLVDHGPYRLDLRIQHRMDRDEVRSGHVPVHVLQCERQVVERVEPVLQQPDDSLGAVWLHPRHGVSHRMITFLVRPDPWLCPRPPTFCAAV